MSRVDAAGRLAGVTGHIVIFLPFLSFCRRGIMRVKGALALPRYDERAGILLF